MDCPLQFGPWRGGVATVAGTVASQGRSAVVCACLPGSVIAMGRPCADAIVMSHFLLWFQCLKSVFLGQSSRKGLNIFVDFKKDLFVCVCVCYSDFVVFLGSRPPGSLPI